VITIQPTTYSEFLEYNMIWWLYLIIVTMYSSATKMHNSSDILACMCHIWSHRLIFGRNTSTLHNHKLISLPYWGMANLKYIIATHMPVQIANDDKCSLSVLAVSHGELKSLSEN